MFNFRPKPLFPWLHIEPAPEEEVPGFRLNPDGSLRERGAASASFGYGNPSAMLTGRYADALQKLARPNFGLSMPSPDFPAPDTTPSASGEYSDPSPTSTSPGAEDSTRPFPSQLPEWLYNVVTMPVPQISTAIDPQTGQRIIPYEPLTGPITAYLKTSEDASGTQDVDPYGDGNSPLPGQDFSKSAAVEPSPYSQTLVWPANIDAGVGAATSQAADPEPTSDPAKNGPSYAEAVGTQDPGSWAGVAASQPGGIAVAPQAGTMADPNFILAKADDPNGPQPPQPMPVPQDQTIDLKNPATPAELPGNPPAPARTYAQALDEFRRATADEIEGVLGLIETYGNRIYEDTIVRAKDDLARLAERLRAEPAETVFSILNSFPQTRVEGGLVGGIAAVITIIANARRGFEFEVAVINALRAARDATKINKNTTKITVDGLGRSIPDILHEGMIEIKSGLEIDNSIQLQIQAAHALANKIPFSLIVSPTTQRISQPIKDAVRASGGTIQRFDPVTRVFTPFE